MDDRSDQRRPLRIRDASLAAVVGYPIINVPMGNVFGLPVGISFLNTAFSQPTKTASHGHRT